MSWDRNPYCVLSTDDVINLVRKTFRWHEKLFNALTGKGEIIAFGGVPRDVLFFKKPVRDIDLVITNTTNESLSKIFDRTIIRRTRFNGLQCLLRKSFVDLWALNETWAFQKGHLSPSIENLPRSVFLSTDAIAVNIGSGEFIEYGFWNSYHKKEIDIVLEENPFPALCVLRALLHKRKYDFELSFRLKLYIEKFLKGSENPIDEIIQAQATHYGKEVLPIGELMHELDTNLTTEHSVHDLLRHAV